MNWFMNLPTPVRLGLMGIGVVLVLVFAMSGTDDNGEEDNRPIPQPAPTGGVSPISPTPAPTISPSPSPTSEPEATYSPVEEDNELADGEIEAAQDVLHEGIENYYAVSSLETPGERRARLAPFFEENSPYLDMIPTGGESTPTGDDIAVDIAGMVGIENPVSARDNTYTAFLIMNVNLIFDSQQSDERVQVIQGSENITVTVSKIDGSWVISDITNN